MAAASTATQVRPGSQEVRASTATASATQAPTATTARSKAREDRDRPTASDIATSTRHLLGTGAARV